MNCYPAPIYRFALFVLLSAAPALAKEISSNGAGGGDWSDPATWRGKKVPRMDYDAVIQNGDTVIFDRNDDGKVTCQKLFLDPKGALHFKTGSGKIIFCVADAVESYGTIRLDGTKSAKDSLELRLVGDSAEKRAVKSLKGATLIVAGRKNLPRDRRNVAITALPHGEKKQEIPGLVEASEGTVFDVQRARIANVQLKASDIDNTGAKVNERVNILESQFTGEGRIYLSGCDTPVIVNNTFTYEGKTVVQPAAISVNSSPLAEIRGNSVRGLFYHGIMGHTQTDSIVAGNTIEKCTNGIYWYGSDVMIKQATIRDCTTGLILTSASGVVENVTVEGATTAYNHAGATAQLTNFQVKNLAKNGVAVAYASGPLTLLNCNILPTQINMASAAATTVANPPPRVTALCYVVVSVKGAPEDTQVEVRTNPAPAKGVTDLNVRNSPAALAKGLTPLPKSLKPLIVKSWLIDPTGKTIPAPEYTLTVLAPAPKKGAMRPVLKTLALKPQDSWFRAKVDSPAPTLEVNLK
jgi:hypothetical protein